MCCSRSRLLGFAFAAQLPLLACLQPLHVAWSILVDASRVLRSGGANSPRFTEGYGEGGRATVHSLPALSSHRMTCSGLSSAGDARGGPVPFWLRRCWRNPRSDTSSNAQVGQPLGKLQPTLQRHLAAHATPHVRLRLGSTTGRPMQHYHYHKNLIRAGAQWLLRRSLQADPLCRLFHENVHQQENSQFHSKLPHSATSRLAFPGPRA